MPDKKFYFLNTLNIGILIINDKREVVFCNDWLKMRSKDGRFVVGKPLEFDTKECMRFSESIDLAIKKGLSFIISNRLNKPPFDLSLGSVRLSYNLSISRVSNNNDGNRSILIQFLDVSQVKEREKYLKDKQTLIDIHEEREIHQEKLNSFIEITSRIAHEINNPLAILDTNTKLMKSLLVERGQWDEDFKEIFVDANETVERIVRLLKSVEELSYMPKKEDFKSYLVKDLIEDIVGKVQDQLVSESIELKLHSEGSIFSQKIEVNKELIEKLFLNLLSNSIKYIKEQKERWIDIDGEVFENRLVINITDSGRGIPGAMKKDIFLPFYTTDEIGSNSIGLGLTTAVKIAEAHLGTLSLDEDCSYTRFTLTLPLKHF